MKCGEADAFTHAYVDGELAGVDRDAYEQHLVECDRCSHCCRLQARFKAAVRGHLPPREVPEGLRRRIEAAIAVAPPPPRRWRWQIAPKLAPAALAAGALMAIVFASQGKPSIALPLQQAMRTFNAPVPMDVVNSSCDMVAEWFRGKVDFPVRPPVEAVGARCEGGRLLTVRDQLAAYLTFRAPSGHKLAVMVFAGGDEDEIQAPVRRMVNGLDVHLATTRGASTASFRGYDGLSYVLIGDIDADSLTNFLTAAFRQQY
jgi:anti-sigma factor RsiW